MEQVLLNLYVNAWQAMPGGGDLYLETGNLVVDEEAARLYGINPGWYVKIAVTDTGVGMDEKTSQRIFEPFFTTKEMGRGTGLGLAMVYGIIQGHKGAINVYSEPGSGTTFNIYLPAAHHEISEETAVSARVTRGTETILLADDEPSILEVSRDIVASLGYTVYAACNGQETLEVYRAKQGEIDLVLLDMVMPGKSGRETFEALRALNPEVKVILSSGYSMNGRSLHIMDQGCNGFLQKPFNVSQLSQKIRMVLDTPKA